MALAVRSITAGRGLDPRDYALAAYGGGGPLHAVAIARELGIPRVVIPPAPSTFSAWGMLATDLRHDLVRTVLEPLERTDADVGAGALRRDGARGRRDPPRRGQARHAAGRRPALPRPGAHGTVALADVDDWDGLRKQFDDAHERAYGYAAPDVEVQLLNLRLTVVFPHRAPALTQLERRTHGHAAVPDANDLLDARRRLPRVPRLPARRSPPRRRDRQARPPSRSRGRRPSSTPPTTFRSKTTAA